MKYSFQPSIIFSGFLAVFLIQASVLFVTTVQAEVYKWTDKEGKVHYSDKPIDDKTKAVKMKREPSGKEIYQANKRAKSLIKHQQKLHEIAQDNAHDKKIITDKEESNEKKRIAFCENAQKQIHRLGRGRRTYTTNDDGSRYFMSDEDKNNMIDEYKSEMSKKRCE
ncbi:MAG: DUF4124 domain-containing protein [Kangiellaceae bacterium]|nr:DUF4124 domain-containing protein [Kangiellaceae bacterium]